MHLALEFLLFRLSYRYIVEVRCVNNGGSLSNVFFHRQLFIVFSVTKLLQCLIGITPSWAHRFITDWLFQRWNCKVRILAALFDWSLNVILVYFSPLRKVIRYFGLSKFCFIRSLCVSDVRFLELKLRLVGACLWYRLLRLQDDYFATLILH